MCPAWNVDGKAEGCTCDEGMVAGRGHGSVVAEGMDEGMARGAAQPGTWRRGGCSPDEGAA